MVLIEHGKNFLTFTIKKYKKTRKKTNQNWFIFRTSVEKNDFFVCLFHSFILSKTANDRTAEFETNDSAGEQVHSRWLGAHWIRISNCQMYPNRFGANAECSCSLFPFICEYSYGCRPSTTAQMSKLYILMIRHPWIFEIYFNHFAYYC